MIETLALRYSAERTQRELSNEYQHDRVYMFFKNLCIIVIWTTVASALEGLTSAESYIFFDLAVVARIVINNLVSCLGRKNSVLFAAQGPHHCGYTLQKASHTCFPSLSSECNVNVLLRFQLRILL